MGQRKVSSLAGITEYPVAQGDWDSSRLPIDTIVLHTEDGFKRSTEAWFNNPQSHVSAHYGVNQDGSYDHFVDENNTAYHAGNYLVNQRSIGIEHEDFGQPNNPRSDALYEASASLVADICRFYGFSPNSNHIKLHREVSSLGTACPDSLDTNRIINRAQQLINPLSQNVTITADQGLNVRQGANTSSNILRALPKGTVVGVTNFVHGAVVSNNDKWWALADGTGYIWSGGTSIVPVDAPAPMVQIVSQPVPPTPTPPAQPAVDPKDAVIADLKKQLSAYDGKTFLDTSLYNTLSAKAANFDSIATMFSIDEKNRTNTQAATVILEQIKQYQTSYLLFKGLQKKQNADTVIANPALTVDSTPTPPASSVTTTLTPADEKNIFTGIAQLIHLIFGRL